MKKIGTDRTLESFKIFPYVAWGITILFAVFVYNITLELKTVTEDLQAQTNYLHDRIDASPELIEDFSKRPAAEVAE